MAEIYVNPKIFDLHFKIYEQKNFMFLRLILEEKSNVNELVIHFDIRFSPHIWIVD